MYLSLRLGPLVRLLTGVAVVSAVVFGLFAVRAPAHSAPATTPPAPPASSARAAADVSSSVFRVAHTHGEGLNVRDCPSAACAKVGWLPEGTSFGATCAAGGTDVRGEPTWLRGTANGSTGYVARHYLATTGGSAALVPADGRAAVG
jgi:hypothetical protein